MTRLSSSFLFAVLSLCTLALRADESVWMMDYENAKQKAQAQNKDLLLHFTRSDRCGWCRKLEKEVLTQPAFLQQVPQQYILLEIDFPGQNQLPPEQSQQNTVLRQQYRIAKFPAVLLCDAGGRPYATISYKEGGAQKYLTRIAELRQNKTKRDQLLELANDQQGAQKARTLEQALSHIPRTALSFYQQEIDAIHAADPEDTSGFHARYQIQKTTINLGYLVKPHLKKRELGKIPTEVDNYITQHQLKDEPLQTALLFSLSAQYFSKDYQAALATADRIIGINEVSNAGRYSASMKKRIQRIQRKLDK